MNAEALPSKNGTPAPVTTGPGPTLDPVELARITAVVIATLRQAGLLAGPMSHGQGSDGPPFVSMKSIAARIGIGESTAWRWHSSGQMGPAGERHGGKRLFARDEVEAWLAASMPVRSVWAPMWKAAQRKK